VQQLCLLCECLQKSIPAIQDNSASLQSITALESSLSLKKLRIAKVSWQHVTWGRILLSAHVRLKKLEQDFEEYHNDMEMQKEEMEMKKQQLETEIGKLKNDTAFWKKWFICMVIVFVIIIYNGYF
ncbi:hypothetical protein Tco_1207573, partial [Tanacetum coccineum]